MLDFAFYSNDIISGSVIKLQIEENIPPVDNHLELIFSNKYRVVVPNMVL